jgi:hypothetical protein
MSVNHWKLISMPVVMLGLASPLLVNCSGSPLGDLKPPGAIGDLADAAKGCDEMQGGDFTKLEIKGDAAVQAKIKGFLNATYGLNKAAVEVRAELISACTDLGKALGAADADLKGEDDDKTAEKACNTAAAKIAEAFKAGASGQITVEVDPPKCYVPIEATSKCLEECGSPIKGGDFKASCKGGEIVGKCEAECKGACTVEAGGECSGSCKAACQGKCEANFKGTCGGKCDGKCDGAAAKGAACAGTCEGKCDAQASGTCGGTCEGKCSGSCELKAKGTCSGTCQGGCSAQVKEPQCTGQFDPPEIDPSCQLSCTAKTVAEAKCEVPNVRIVAKGKVVTGDVKKLATALQISIPRIIRVQLGTAKRLGTMSAAVVKAGADVQGVATAAGGKAAACIASGVKASVSASASIDVNIKASASVGGSLKAGG